MLGGKMNRNHNSIQLTKKRLAHLILSVLIGQQEEGPSLFYCRNASIFPQ
jgi:hypothetical protein